MRPPYNGCCSDHGIFLAKRDTKNPDKQHTSSYFAIFLSHLRVCYWLKVYAAELRTHVRNKFAGLPSPSVCSLSVSLLAPPGAQDARSDPRMSVTSALVVWK